MQIFSATDTGAVREENQDSFAYCIKDEAAFLIVCDGLGGHLGGKRASLLACEFIEEKIKSEYKKEFSQGKLEEFLRQCVNEANVRIWECSVKEPENRGMGTTAVIATVRNGRYTVINLGDSRAYMISDEKITQITKDQSYVQSLIDKGEITREEAKDYPGKSIILQAAGLGDKVNPDIYKGNMEKAILLCTDGLTNELEENRIFEIVLKEGPDAVQELVKEANISGGYDNITVVLGLNE